MQFTSPTTSKGLVALASTFFIFFAENTPIAWCGEAWKDNDIVHDINERHALYAKSNRPAGVERTTRGCCRLLFFALRFCPYRRFDWVNRHAIITRMTLRVASGMILTRRYLERFGDVERLHLPGVTKSERFGSKVPFAGALASCDCWGG